MDDPVKLDPEIQEMRRELEDIRRAYAALQKPKAARLPSSGGRESAQSILHRPALARIDKRLTALEERLSELEARRASAVVN